MPSTAVRLDVLEAADVARNFTAQLSFYRELLYRFAQRGFLLR